MLPSYCDPVGDLAASVGADGAGEVILARVNGAAGIVSWLRGGQAFSVMGFTIRRKKIVEIDILADPVRLRQLDLTVLDDLRR